MHASQRDTWQAVTTHNQYTHMSWLTKIKELGLTGSDQQRDSKIPSGLWQKCPSCDTALYVADMANKAYICSKCDHHLRMTARTRIDTFLDANERTELGAELSSQDFLKFRDVKKYKDRLTEARKKTGENEALITIAGSLKKLPIVTAAFEFSYMGGSMGSIVGEKFQLCCEYALEHRVPFVCFTASGGARMQEGLTSLFQMTKTSAATEQLKQHNIPYISILTDPTFGGVSASLAMLGDIIIAEPGASIGFAGARVIEQTVREKLPQGFQTSEFLLAQGAIDMVVNRAKMRDTVHSLLMMLSGR